MPRQFVEISESEFQLDGIAFDKVFVAFPVASDSLKVVCAYESRNEILPVTRFDEIQVDGVTPTDQANAISLLKGVVFNSILSGGSSGYKGTKVHWLSLSGIDTSLDELKYIAEAVKSKGAFTCDEGEQMVFQTSIPLGEGSGVYGVLQRWYRLLPSLTTIGGTTDPVPASYFMPDGRVEVLDSSLFIDLGTITSPDTVESVFNQGDSGAAWNVQDEQFVTAVLDGVSIIWRFNGGFGLWGGDDLGTDPEVLEATAANFDNLSEQPETSTGENSAFYETDGSSPLTDPSADGYRTGKTGFGQSTPTELIHIEGDQASGSGAFKNRFDYSSGLVVLNQLGGNNIGTELGFPSNVLKGALIGYITGNPNYAGQQMVIMGGDFLLAGAQKNWGWTIGNFSSNGQEYSALFTEPLFTNSVDDFLTKIKSINANGDHAHFHAKTKGYENETTPIEDFGEEALVELNAENSEGDRTRVYISPHRVQLGKLLKLPEYALDTYVEGYAHTDSVAKTGTAATVLGAPVKALAVDANGYVVRAHIKASVTPDTGSSVNLSNPFGNYCNQSSANTNTAFTTSNEIAGGKARVLINAASEPTVTGGTKIKGSDFIASTNIYLCIEYNGTYVEFWFEEI